MIHSHRIRNMFSQGIGIWMSVLLIASLVLSACATQQPTVAPPQRATATTIPPSPTPVVNLDMVYNTLWVLVAYGDAANPTVVAEGTQITATFSPDGSLTGSSGCNNYAGKYQASPDGQLTISSPMASTQ